MIFMKCSTRLPIICILRECHHNWKQKHQILVKALSTSSRFQKWEVPKGHETGISVYNSVTHQKVPLILKRKGIATWYMCGPTVYDDSHIGHASCYVKFDIIRRVMQHMFNINVIMLMGVTDIDDKIIEKSRKVGKNFQEISKKYELDFFNDLELMNVQLPTLIGRVSDYIPHIISFCKRLVDKEFAYVTTEGNVYFSVPKIDGQDIEVETTTNEFRPVLDPLKKDPRDFALWKAAKPDEPWWMSPWGKGRPGWHIECSTIASCIFGSQMDIHSGGLDLLFPHHANERSQSEAFHGNNQWVNYWLHAGLLHIHDDVKMSKSLKNTISIKEFLKENTANDFRIICLQSPYRNSILYSQDSLEGAQNVRKKLHTFLNEAELYIDGELLCGPLDDEDLLAKLVEAKDFVCTSLADDFNTSQALLCIVNLIGEINKQLQPLPLAEAVGSAKGSTNIIAAYAIYVDQTLQMLGVNIVCKKKLPKLFVYIVDAVITYRGNIRLFALKSDSLSHIDIEQSTFEEKTYLGEWNKHKSLLANAADQLKTELQIVGVNMDQEFDWCLVDNKTKDSFPLLQNNMELSDDFKLLMNALSIFCKEIQLYEASVLCNQGSIDITNHLDNKAPLNETELASLQKKFVKLEKKKKAPLLKACDKFRTSLQYAGIGVKDRKDTSTWFPLDDRQVDSVGHQQIRGS